MDTLCWLCRFRGRPVTGCFQGGWRDHAASATGAHDRHGGFFRIDHRHDDPHCAWSSGPAACDRPQHGDKLRTHADCNGFAFGGYGANTLQHAGVATFGRRMDSCVCPVPLAFRTTVDSPPEMNYAITFLISGDGVAPCA